MSAPFDLGLYVGRFQHIHIGHESVIEHGLKLCRRLLVLVGSSQEVGTLRNPFDVYTRMELIKEIYPEGDVIVRPLPDLSHEDDISPAWGRYVLDTVRMHANKLPEIMIYGNDERRSEWFDPRDIRNIAEFIVSRERLDISATMMRYYLLRSQDPVNRDLWHQHSNQHLHKHYERLRQALVNAPGYSEIMRMLQGPREGWTDKGDWLLQALGKSKALTA